MTHDTTGLDYAVMCILMRHEHTHVAFVECFSRYRRQHRPDKPEPRAFFPLRAVRLKKVIAAQRMSTLINYVETQGLHEGNVAPGTASDVGVESVVPPAASTASQI